MRVALTTAQRMNAVAREKADESDSTPDSESDDEDDELTDDVHTHTVIFKCIGAAKEHQQQDVLSGVKQ